MAAYLDDIQLSGITRIRDLMFTLKDPFRLDQGDVSFDSPQTVKDAMARAIADNKTHYVQTNGIPRLRELIAAKLRDKNKTPIETPDEILVTNGGIHGVYVTCQALLEPGDEVVIPDPEWPPVAGNVLCARAVPVPCPLREELGWRWDLDELASKITPKTRILYVNTPGNPTGGVLTRADLEQIARIATERNLWVIADEAYEDVVFEGEHVSLASLPGMYERTIPIYTFSKSYAMTGLRLGYVAIKNAVMRDRAKKVLFHTASNISSVVQWGGVGALEGSQACIEEFRTELRTRRDFFYTTIKQAAGDVFTGAPPAGAFYAFMKIDPAWTNEGTSPSISWRMAEFLIKNARLGCVPGVDFGRAGEGYVRFCFARETRELAAALESMHHAIKSQLSGLKSQG
ncbi:MAG TPA: pyridoxal phosphate-dependent aminotransferase [Vicinamibacterales bacterium]|nr:pyridoxal phosphate-dependent aminotransferase [Vicinamibacterales bacterium]